ncbi:hypothetical protein KRR40_01070 [Niabella defluvii]|nr:hypothetical protein KRR40_01070 [Niabella sp. I65]
MFKKVVAFAVAGLVSLNVWAMNADDLIGRWDITLDKDGKAKPSWLEVKLSGMKTLVGYFVGDDGSARPVSKVKLENGKFSFAIPRNGRPRITTWW